ncbi:hypothetical protein C474_02461 [Halogeometricum pallidum JCM 14848]|uniref:Lipoprotein n=1 Tax=Halogeometricum pallidum JCM 14848 TaxID=1227487 RepID=M0DGD2_HALPD|nr:hypothetical protein [Halogeometricum pallidum]ELZ34531.1 hypothetical protein C474_02461 [Halogeometricum pallidum JCM 14848]
MPSGRDFLASASVVLGAGVAGCSAVPAPRPTMDVGVMNWRDRTLTVTVLEEASHHYHYRPDCGGPDDPEPGLLVTLTGDRSVRFTQATCSDDEPFV